MRAHRPPSQHRRQAAIGAVLTLALGWLAWWGEWMDPASYDIPLVMHPAQKVTNAVIVSIEEETYRRLVSIDADKGKILDRKYHVDLLNRLEKAGAKAVVFDLNFESPWTVDDVVDVDLSQAMVRMSNVVLAAKLQYDPNNPALFISSPTFPIEILRTNAHVGFAEVALDPDQVLRRHFTDPNRKSLAWVTVTMLGKTPGRMDEPRWIRYYGRPPSVPTLPYYQVLDTNQFSDMLLTQKAAGKVVFVGQGLEEKTSDWHLTPHTKYVLRPTSGVEIQATAFLNLWNEDWLRRLPWPLELTILFGAGTLLGGGLVFCRPWAALGWALASAVLTFVAAVLLMWETRWWFSWLTLSAIQVPVALGWSLFSRVARLQSLAGRGQEPAPLTVSQPSLKETASATPVIPDHTLVRCVGRGGYGEVWLSRNFLGAYHAVKVVHRQRFEAREPYERELRGVKNFMPISRGHAGWVPILHVGHNEAEEYFYYVMEAADDETAGTAIDPETYRPKTLARVLELRGALPLAECVDLGLSLAAGLDYLHNHRLVHRDIKTSNLVYLGGAPRFVDFGLVTEMALPGHEASYVGSHDYLPPEGPGAPAADVYALGKVLYVAMSGLEPAMYPELPTRQAEAAHESGLLPFYQVVAQACEADRRRRFQSAQQLHEALRRLKGQH